MADDGMRPAKDSRKNEVPYGLHGFDQPGSSLVSTMLNGRNYLSWSVAVKTALEAKKKVGFIDGRIKPPEDAEEYQEWKCVDSMIKSWITNSIQEEIKDTFVFALTSKALWDVLEERFSVSNGPQLYHIQRQTNSLRQGGDTVTIYYNKLHRCWDELDRMMPMPTCTCGKCSCGLNKKLADMMSSTKLLQFLMGLNPIYDVVRTQILNLDPLPSVNKAFHVDIKPRMSHLAIRRRKHLKATKKAVVAAVKDSSNNDSLGLQDSDSNPKDIANAVSYLLKEVQRLGKNKVTNTKDEQVNFANLYDFAGALKTVHLPDKSTKQVDSIGKEQKSNHLLARG
ncbi:uncharacterized protein G2W53_002175 [Senna tora]|uniref:Retrotransposon Copia-like N-terminal domain-containing protein n=1 Tax=Senna tora TaxID=362788 RepID=A0A834XIU5_9FABA|nr:uncharacterized protein G2W53_002175 [Senna tora]